MSNVLIVGFGNIGLRHCESLIKFKKIKKIFIFDTNYQKVLNFKKKVKNKKIIILKNLNLNKNNFFLSIIATNSDVRFSLFEKIVKNFKVKFFIFEKVVFQKQNEYDYTKRIIEQNKLKCWINCPRRTWSIFKNIKKNINREKKISLIISGNSWGILSNAIHFIDLFVFFTRSSSLNFNFKHLSKRLFKTKRKGFYESDGEILVRNEKNDTLILKDKKSNKKNRLILKLYNEKKYFYFDQNNLTNKFQVPLQSNETLKHAKNILKNGRCNLPSYLRTYEIHKLFCRDIGIFFKKSEKKFLFT